MRPLILCGALLWAMPAPAQNLLFTDVTGPTGIVHNVQDEGLFNAWGGGVSFLDLNEDGLDDLVIVNGPGQPLGVFLNEDGTQFSDWTGTTALSDTADSEMTAWADFDNDGDKDVYVTYFDASDRLYRNNGNFTFEDITGEAGLLAESERSMSAVWADFDNDRFLDLFVVHYLDFEDGGQNNYYRNNGDGTFTEMAVAAGVDQPRLAFTAVAFDYDNDGLLDIYVANDKDLGNQLFRNLGNHQFEDVSDASRSGIRMGAMGLAVGDYNNDGFDDLFISNDPRGNYLLRNDGNGTFFDVTASMGVEGRVICWGANFIDYDNDGLLDLYVSSSGDDYNARGNDKPNFLFRNFTDNPFVGRYIPQLEAAPANNDIASWGNAIGDYNNDGYMDIAVFNQGDRFVLWQNNGGSNHWIKLLLEGTQSNRDGVGARITLHTGGKTMYRTTHAGTSYKAQNSFIQTIGIGAATVVDSLTVRWPSGRVDRFTSVSADEGYRIVEGSGLTPTAAVQDEVPQSVALHANYPNPFSGETVIGYTLDAPYAGQAPVLRVFDALGRLVRTWSVNGGAGRHEVRWDGTAQGRRVAGGVYFYQFDTGTRHITRRMIVVQ